jgi:hypothetical protein
MIRIPRFHTTFASLATAAAIFLTSLSAEAQVVPFNIKGGGAAPSGLNLIGVPAGHNATGTANQLGKYTGDEGIAQVLTFNPVTGSGTFHGSFVFVAANGDRLVCDYGGPGTTLGEPGTFGVIDANAEGIVVQFFATFTPRLAECTGKYAKLNGGSFFMVATSSRFPLVISDTGFTPPFDYTWVGRGGLSFNRRR